MGKVKLIVHECFTGKQNPEDVVTAIFLSKCGKSFLVKTLGCRSDNNCGSSDYYYSCRNLFSKQAKKSAKERA